MLQKLGIHAHFNLVINPSRPFKMASPAKISLRRAVDDVLTCGICFEIVEQPKVLPCLHTFCRECLDALIKRAGGETIRCPLCAAIHSIPQRGVDGFRTNFTLQNLVEARQVTDAENDSLPGITCESGLDENRGISRCIDCAHFLCTSCQDLHKKLKATRGHRIIPLNEIKNDVRKLEYKRFCLEHEEEELKLFCRDCKEVICRDCTIVGHKGHEYDFIKTVFPKLQTDIRDLVRGDLERKCAEFEDHLAYVNQVNEKSSSNIESCVDQVKSYYHEYRKRLDVQETMLLESLDATLGERSKQLAIVQETVETSKAKLDSAREFAKQLLDNGIPVDLAMMYKQTRQRLENLKEESWDRNTTQPCRLVFVPDEGDDPFKAKVRGGINRMDLVVEGLGQPVLGTNKFNVKLVSDVNAYNLVVTIVNDNGDQLRDIDVKVKGANKWEVTYKIASDGVYVISVLLDGVEAQKSPFIREWRARLLPGMKVARGNDWKWGDQDGGPGGVGNVVGWSEEVGASDNWAKIKWDITNRQNNYRWGAEGAYDLMVVPQQ